MIRYKRRHRYKYTLVDPFSKQTELKPETRLGNDFLNLDGQGVLHISAGYSWDGPSGPTIDTPNFMQGSLVHDALYQMIREEYLDYDHRKYADELLREMCMEDSMSWIRATLVYYAVRIFGASAAKPDTRIAP